MEGHSQDSRRQLSDLLLRYDDSFEGRLANEIRALVKRNTERLEARVDQLRARACEIDSLQEENDRLREALAQQKPNLVPTEISHIVPLEYLDDGRARTALIQGNEQDERNIPIVSYEKYARLESKYNRMKKQAAVYRETVGRLKQRHTELVLQIKNYQKEWDSIYGSLAAHAVHRFPSIPSLSLVKQEQDDARRLQSLEILGPTEADLPEYGSRRLSTSNDGPTIDTPSNDGISAETATPAVAEQPCMISKNDRDHVEGILKSRETSKMPFSTTSELNGSLLSVAIDSSKFNDFATHSMDLRGPDKSKNYRNTTPDELNPATSTQSTDASNEAEAADLPVVVGPDQAESQALELLFERNVKRKRQIPAERMNDASRLSNERHQDGSPERPIKIKDEHFSSQVDLAAYSALQSDENLDLDELAGKIETPRKRRFQNSLIDSSQRKIKRIPNSSVFDECDVDQLSALPLDMYEFHSNKPVMSGTVDETRSAPASNSNNVLQPVDSNQQILPRTSTSKSRPRNAVHCSSFAELASRFAEDGDDITRDICASHAGSRSNLPDSRILTTPTSATRMRAQRQSRVQDLLEGDSAEQHRLRSIAKESSSTKSSEPPLKSFERPSSASRTVLARPRSRGANLFQPNTYSTAGQTSSNKGRLRKRPLTKLTLDDFKINSKNNKGVDYPFTEIVRGRERRQCLPNCTRPECCGERFAKVVEIGGALMLSNGLFDSSQEDSDEALIRKHMDNQIGRLDAMTNVEKSELAKRLRADEFAVRYGKHRPAHQRRSSPPGFWNTGMPNTQELDRDRELARQEESRKIKERYTEALRPDGLWKFRDE